LTACKKPWLPIVDEFRNEFTAPSDEMLATFTIFRQMELATTL
jgi:hypothetical protein